MSVNKPEIIEHSLVEIVCDELLQRTGIRHDKTGYHSAGTLSNLIKSAYMNDRYIVTDYIDSQSAIHK